MTKISLVIATFNGAKRITGALKSLTRQTLDKELWDVVVVNNNSTDNTAEVVEKFIAEHPELHIRLVSESRQGLSYARNRGIDETDGDYIAIMDDDEVASPALLAEYFEFLDTHPYAVAAGGKITPYYLSQRPKWMCRITERPIAGTLDLGKEIILFPEGKYFGGGNMCLRRTAIEYYGKFDTNLGRRGSKLLGGEEKELYMRYYASGENIYYLPNAEIKHVIGRERLSKPYFKAVCYRIGQSERIRTLGISQKAFSARLRSELVKWCATILISLFYCVTLQFPKAQYLVIMRRQISRGLKDANIDKEL